MSNIPICIYVLVQQTDLNIIQNECQKFSQKHSNVKCIVFISIFDCAKTMALFEADMILIDGTLLAQFIHAIETFKSKEILFTFKRFVIFSTQKTFSEKRLLELSLFGVRSTFVGIKNFQNALQS